MDKVNGFKCFKCGKTLRCDCTADSSESSLNGLLCAKTSEMVQEIYAQREKIMEAFIAETGLLPSECEQVTQWNKWWVQKRT